MHDICLIKTSDTFKFDETVQAAVLPTRLEDKFYPGVYVTGWGDYIENGKQEESYHLRRVIQKVGRSKNCTERFKGYNETLDICLFPYPTGGLCSGDSGAGYVWPKFRNESQFLLFGVHSAGRCKGNAIGTRVYGYIDWIREVTQIPPR